MRAHGPVADAGPPVTRERSLSVMTAVIAVIVALCSCADGQADRGPASEIRDSAGVAIVENHAPELAPGSWRVTDRRVLCSSEGTEGDARIHQVADIVPLGRDSVAIQVHATQEILICSGGSIVGSFGGEGDGPGEFRSISGVFAIEPDSVAVVERRRATVVDYAGRGRTITVDAVAGGSAREFRSARGLLAAIGATRDARTFEAARVADLHLLRPDGTVAKTLPSVPWDPSLGLHTVLLFLWEGGVHWAIGPRGYWRASRDTSELRFYDETGLALSARAPHAPIPMTPELWERGAQQVETIEFDPPMPDEVIESFVAPPDDFEDMFAPAVSRILLDADGPPWVRVPERDPLREPQEWRVFSPEGVWITDVEVPMGVYLQTIENGRLFGVVRSELGLETVVAFRLVKDGG